MAKSKDGQTIWFQRWMLIGLMPVSLTGYLLVIVGVGAAFGFARLGDWLSGKGHDLAGLAYLAAFLVPAAVVLLGYRHSARQTPY
ncbi:hypothetical protein [Caulobacter sp. 17J80-11]|uniref:hypothetical protein n=1 Tax=Caulobacter sp. 17J80-11 TaxID=2763502 RepID=UPI00165371BC|nr:hypothetical protein [Caulobacter sp. 17J80-11]MBC6983179.1 hypothetical protein [Caulobacter sp. 17J80-11]